MFKNIFRRLTGKYDKAITVEEAARAAGLDEETIEAAKQLVYERKVNSAVNAKWKPHRKGQTISGDELLEALRSLKPDAASIMKKVFERTVEDTVLANRFSDKSGKEFRHLTVKKAAAMDGLRDLDDDVQVAAGAASPMNPEGRFNVPLRCDSNHQFAERFNEAMNPVRNGRFNCIIPELILQHFANFGAFIGYPACEVISLHPTVSNACTIPGEDAIAPGYTLSFIDSEDLDGNGVPDDLEAAEMGGVKRALGRLGAMEALKDAIRTLSEPETANDSSKDSGASVGALALALERLAAYEAWEREVGAGDDAAKAVNEGFIKPITAEFEKFSQNQGEKERKDAVSTLSLALSDISKREHPSLDEVRSTQNRRGTISAVIQAKVTLEKPEEEWDSVRSLNDLAVAIERVAAYETFSDRNAEVMSALNMALVELSTNVTPESKKQAIESVSKAVAAMDSADFDFEDVSMDGVSKPTEESIAETQRAEAGKAAEAEQRKAMTKANNENAKADKEAALAQAQMMAEQQAQEQAMAQMQAQQQAEADAKKAEEEKREKTRIAAEVAKERQKYLDQWKKRADEMGMNAVCTKLARNARVFGIGIAIPIVDDVDYEKPMDFKDVHEGAYHGFTVIEPIWIYPETESNDLINPMSGMFYEPSYWCVTGSSFLGSMGVKRIHHSWMTIVRNKEVPSNLRPMYYFGGIPLTQEIYEAVFCADKVMNEVPKLAMTKRTVVVKGDPNDMITNPEGVVERLQATSQVQDNFGRLYVGRNTDVMQLETSLSEFDQLIAKCNQRVAAIAKMPETKLFKTQLAGMNSAGRYEWDDYSQLLINIQNNWFKPILALHYSLDTLSRTGKVIELKIAFNPIDVPTEAEKGEAESRKVQTINSALQAGWLAPAEARTIARGGEDSMFSAISAEMPEELEQQQQGGMQGGMPGMDPSMMGGMPQIPGVGDGMPERPETPKEPEMKDPINEPKEPKEPNFKAPTIKSL